MRRALVAADVRRLKLFWTKLRPLLRFHESNEHLAERLVKRMMNSMSWTEARPATRAEGDEQKAALAFRPHRVAAQKK
jgi:hypothetical protein